jgi:hypothetical protein
LRVSDEVLFDKYIALTRDLGRLPVEGEIRRKSREDQSFPCHTSFNRFGGKNKLVETLAAYCRERDEFEDVLALCAEHVKKFSQAVAAGQESERKLSTEYVYLMKSGPHYKIGRTNSVGRRGSELSIKIPVPPRTIHTIGTDDPAGVELYWHKRFADKRGQGEWFVLTQEDVTAFKRWRRIV